nr:tyrosine-type recombinase/integrase [uncultured Ligilactobacillus sp.]
MKKAKILPIKDEQILKQVEDTLLNKFQYGMRNYTIFQVGKMTLLRVSDVLSLHYHDVFDEQGKVKLNAYLNSSTALYLDPLEVDLVRYRLWRETHRINSMWLFPSMQNQQKSLSPHQYYKIMQKIGDLLDLDYLGTDTMRKTGAYQIYQQTHHNITFVMKLLNYTSEKRTLTYLGLNDINQQTLLDTIDFK